MSASLVHLSQSGSPMTALPSELLLMVFEALRPSRKALINSALCCKVWSQPAQEILYKHLVLTERTVTACFDITSWRAPRMQKAVQSLTIRIVSGSEMPVPSVVRDTFQNIGQRIAEMVNLKSVSYFRYVENASFKSVPETILSHVPMTCTSVELEEEGAHLGNSAHICSLVRERLPNLEHLRIRWPTLCPDLFEQSSVETGIFNSQNCITNFETSDGKRPRTLLISIVGSEGKTATHCRDASQSALQALLRTISPRVGSPILTELEHFSIISGYRKRTNDPRCSTFIRHDIKTGESHALPWLFTGKSHRPEWMIRLPQEEGGDFVSPDVAPLMELAEKSVWQTSLDGSRLPAPLRARFGLVPQKCVRSRYEQEEDSVGENKLWALENGRILPILSVEVGELADQPIVADFERTR